MRHRRALLEVSRQQGTTPLGQVCESLGKQRGGVKRFCAGVFAKLKVVQRVRRANRHHIPGFVPLTGVHIWPKIY